MVFSSSELNICKVKNVIVNQTREIARVIVILWKLEGINSASLYLHIY